jgi:hypothetical protein
MNEINLENHTEIECILYKSLLLLKENMYLFNGNLIFYDGVATILPSKCQV